jgi:Bacterial PH domain
MGSTSVRGDGFAGHVYQRLQSAAQSMTTFLDSLGTTRLQNLGAAGLAKIDMALLPHEELVISERQHPALLAGPSALALAGLPVASVLTVFLYRDEVLVLAVWIAWLLLFLRLVWKTVNWFGNFFVVTSERMLFLSGLLAKEVAMIPYLSTTDMSYRISPAGRLFGYGSFIVEYGGQDRLLVLNSIDFIPNPEQHYLKICDLIFEPENIETVACPICNGDGSIFRRTQEKAEISGQAKDSAASPAQDSADLLARGYEKAICPRCDGRGTVSARSGS